MFLRASRKESVFTLFAVGMATLLGLLAGCGGGGDDDGFVNNPYGGTYASNLALADGTTGSLSMSVPSNSNVATVGILLTNAGGNANSNGSFSGTMNTS